MWSLKYDRFYEGYGNVNRSALGVDSQTTGLFRTVEGNLVLPPISAPWAVQHPDQYLGWRPFREYDKFDIDPRDPRYGGMQHYPSTSVSESLAHHPHATSINKIHPPATSYPSHPQDTWNMHLPTASHNRHSLKHMAPYPCSTAAPQSVGYGADAVATLTEGPIPKVRKRATAEQLMVLNEVYQRTPFPTTEEREFLGRQLNMVKRSVQIWFQNKRQSERRKLRYNETNSQALPRGRCRRLVI